MKTGQKKSTKSPAAKYPTHARLARQALQITMSDYSENNWAAGWLSEIEFQLWGM